MKARWLSGNWISNVLPRLERTVASWPLTIRLALSLFSVMTIRIPRYGKMSVPSATAAQGTSQRGSWPANSFFTRMVLTLCAAARDTVIMEVSGWLLKACEISQSWRSPSWHTTMSC